MPDFKKLYLKNYQELTPEILVIRIIFVIDSIKKVRKIKGHNRDNFQTLVISLLEALGKKIEFSYFFEKIIKK